MNTHSITLESFIKDNTPDGMEYDKENSTLDDIVYKAKEKSTRWEDLEEVEGWYSDERSQIHILQGGTYRSIRVNANIYATEAQCAAHLAQAKLSQIMKEVNGDWAADWSDGGQCKYYLVLGNIDYKVLTCWRTPRFLTFKSRELAEQVLRENADLLEQYRPLAG